MQEVAALQQLHAGSASPLQVTCTERHGVSTVRFACAHFELRLTLNAEAEAKPEVQLRRCRNAQLQKNISARLAELLLTHQGQAVVQPVYQLLLAAVPAGRKLTAPRYTAVGSCRRVAFLPTAADDNDQEQHLEGSSGYHDSAPDSDLFSTQNRMCDSETVADTESKADQGHQYPASTAVEQTAPILQLLTTADLELLAHVFSFLDLVSLSRAARVCRTFYQVRWKNIDLSSVAAPAQHYARFQKLDYLLVRQPTCFTMQGWFAQCQPISADELHDILRTPSLRTLR